MSTFCIKTYQGFVFIFSVPIICDCIASPDTPGPCYYAGNSEGGKSGELPDYNSVIEGKYTDYQVDGLFGYKYAYSQFEEDKCIQTAA